MIYLDYSANTPVDPAALDVYCKTEQTYIANPNSTHCAGQAARAEMARVTESIASLLGVQPAGTRWEMLLFLLAVELLGAVLFTLVEKPLAQYSRRWEWDKLKIVDPV